jgi:hypothetical protein
MGFSRFWDLVYKPSENDFAAFAADCKLVLDGIGIPLTHLTRDRANLLNTTGNGWKPTAGIYISPKEIRFDAASDGCETFCFKRQKSIEACKTNKRPYDVCVQACLLLAKYHFSGPNCSTRITIGSDDDHHGFDTMWGKGFEAVRQFVPMDRVCGINQHGVYLRKNNVPAFQINYGNLQEFDVDVAFN